MKALIALLAMACIAISTPAMAQLKKPAVTGDLAKDLQTDFSNNQAAGTPSPKLDLNALWTKMQQVSIADLQYAKALADGTKTSGGTMRSACWGAWIAAVQAQQGINAVGPDGKPLGTKPDPAVFTTFEQLAEVVDSLQPTSPFMVACTPVANAFRQNVLQLVTMVVSGATSLGALGVAIP